MTDREKTLRYNSLIREVCAYEIRLGQSIGYYNAVILTHRAGGPREMIDRLYGE